MPSVKVTKGPCSYWRASNIFSTPSSVTTAKTRPWWSHATTGASQARMTPVQTGVRTSHSLQVRSSEALRNASDIGDIASDTTRPVWPCAQHRDAPRQHGLPATRRGGSRRRAGLQKRASVLGLVSHG